MTIKNIKFYLFLMLFTMVTTSVFALEGNQKNETKGQKSPLFSGNIRNVRITYNDMNDTKERISKKIAVRDLYLVPYYFNRKCSENSLECSDQDVQVFLYMELQSIWPDPFLLTASGIKLVDANKNITQDRVLMGPAVLASKITQNVKPRRHLFNPGEVKTIALEQGFTLKGLLDFFTNQVLDDAIVQDEVPIRSMSPKRVSEFNNFIREKYGKQSSLRISLYEKDYKIALDTTVELGNGKDLFAHGDVIKNSYELQHDAFIGEMIYRLKGGRELFDTRFEKKLKSLDN